MPIVEQYESNNFNETPETHGKPGYTGVFPESGPKRNFQMGKIYEQWTHDVIASHPVAGLRFGTILNSDETLQRNLEDECMAWKHEINTQNLKFRRDMMVGYAGFVPRRRFICGKSYSDECKTAIAEFEKMKTRRE